MIEVLLLVLIIGVVGSALAAVWQHFRYLDARRTHVDDWQPLLYGSDAFHAVTFLKLAPGAGRADELATVRALRDAIEVPEGGQVVYAGLVAVTMAPSTQLENDWDAVVFAQYPSRDAFDGQFASAPFREVLSGCARTYVHGVERPVLMNFLTPIGLAGLRLRDIVLRRGNVLPFEPASEEETLPGVLAVKKEIQAFEAYRDLREDAVVVVNLIQPGTKEQQAADNAYVGEMMRGMAEGGYGPMHLGRAVRVEGAHRFSQFAAVYYPGIDHMHAMIGSRFMSRIGGGKQLGDTLAVATIPVLSQL